MFYRKEKIITPQKAIRKLKNRRLVFTSGIFDILHYGHIYFLRNAKKIVKNDGNLLVCIHSDQFVKKFKGKNRPFIESRERMEILSELCCVDYVSKWDGWESITEFALNLEPKFFAITSKHFEHSNNKNWDGLTWNEVASKTNSEIIKIPLFRNYSTSSTFDLKNTSSF